MSFPKAGILAVRLSQQRRLNIKSLHPEIAEDGIAPAVESEVEVSRLGSVHSGKKDSLAVGRQVSVC